MFIYSPYWLINKTGLHVDYRVSKIVHVSATITDTEIVY